MSNKTNPRRAGRKRAERPTCWRDIPRSCAAEGHNGRIGRAKWKRLSRRKMRRTETLEDVFPHLRSRLRHYDR